MGSIGENTITDNNVIGIQKSTYTTLKDIKISSNNNDAEYNREPMYSTTFLNFLEYSPDYTESNAV